MNFLPRFRPLAALALAASTFAVQAPFAHAGNHFTPPGMGMHPCTFSTQPCPPSGGGGSGGSGGGLGPFGKGIVGGIGMGVGLGLVQGLTRPQQPQVIVQQPQPTYVQPAPVQVAPPPQPVSSGLSPHDQFCLGKYKSYNIQTKQYLSYSGSYKFCQSPYM